jgi:dipeptidyl aminopeptidase/acylaminoacyl peptidase
MEGAPSGTARVRVFDVAERETMTIEGLPERVSMPSVSPDGRWLAFTAFNIRPSIFVRPFAAAGAVRQVNAAAGYSVWNTAGDKLYFRTRRGGEEGSAEDGVFELPIDPVRGIAAGPERQLFRKAFTEMLGGVPGFDLSSDGRFLLVLSDTQESLPPEPNVILHVDDELRRRRGAQ